MRMKRLLGAAAVVAAVFGLTACGDPVEVPPAHVGKMSTQNGLQKDIIPPSKFRLEGFCVNCDNLILAEASDYPVKESMKIYMPKDELNLDVEVRGTFAVSNDKETMNRIFDRIPAQATNNGRVKLITMDRIYQTYAQPIIREAVRSVIAEYEITEVMQNREAIGTQLTQVVREKLSVTPVTVNQFGLADLQPPQIIITAQESAREREIDIQKAEADKLVKLKEAEAALEVAIKQQQVDLKEAETQVLVNQKLAEGVNQAFIAQRALKVLEQMATSNNKVIFMPTEAMKNPALMLGAVNQSLRAQ